VTTLAHLSDLHGTDPCDASTGDLLGKRFFGWASWKLKRRKRYRPAVLSALIEDLQRQEPSHVAITGDLTQIALEPEFEEAAIQLRKLGDASRVSAIPGNHDAYVGIPYSRSWAKWNDYLRSDSDLERVSADLARMVAGHGAIPGKSNAFAFPGYFPTLRIRGELALVGVCTALPTGPFLASGRVGPLQLERLEALLVALDARGLHRVVMVHHPILPGEASPRRHLSDAPAMREMLERTGAELVLHGHNHRTAVGALGSGDGEIPVIGVRSGSYAGDNPEKQAQYHLYRFEDKADEQGYRLSMRIRGWDSQKGEVVEIGAPVELPGR
jgi:3',5'-cyclic AMP phosphodiesterase CpdA